MNKFTKAATQSTESVVYTQSMKSWRMIVIFDELRFVVCIHPDEDEGGRHKGQKEAVEEYVHLR